jgi:hypothetical protein
VRQGQQNRRGRGRNNNRGGKGGHHNPLSRSFESNGPAERIRGTPAHIAEKYLSLARDAQTTGDPVLAENYLQHAEHYNRIIMAYRDQFTQPHEGGMNGGGQRGMRPGGDMGGEGFDDGDDDLGGDDGFPQPFVQAPAGHQPQPRAQEQRQPGGEHGRPERSEGRGDRPERPDRPERHDRQDRQDRPFRRDRDQRPPRFGDRERPDRGERQGFVERDRQPEAREVRGEAPERGERADASAEPAAEPRRRGDRFQQPHEQPEFLRRPVRRVRSSENGNGEAPSKTETSGE